MDQKLCAISDNYNEGVCRGHGGGPAMMIRNNRYYIVGINSYIWGCRTRKSEAPEKVLPVVFARVTHFHDWIIGDQSEEYP